ncbi:MAG TPA: Uma2 family endonuclease [Planctomycetota bacterium]|nr:Uma2 family endonuclease [Planctomycetota bacterium]
MPVLTKPWTEAELLALPKDDGKCELVNGELICMSPAGPDHGDQTLSFGAEVQLFVKRRKLGKCYDGQTGFWMKSDNLRSPDISYIPNERLPLLEKARSGAFYFGAPDLVVEVLSITERPKDIADNLRDYFESGTRLAWLLVSFTKTVRVYRDPVKFKLLRVGDTLTGEDVLPGFKIALAKIFSA